MISKDAFTTITDTVIKNLEGGYFHRNMLKDGRVKDPEGLFSKGPGRVDSGETMFGIDRVNGIGLSKLAPKEWADFWTAIDKAGWAKTAKYDYRGGDLAPKLRQLAAAIMYQAYLSFSKLYFIPEARTIVDSDPRIVFNFSYACWNGQGWFERYASVVNKAVKKGTKDKEAIYKIVTELRTKSNNKLIRKTGEKIESLFSSVVDTVKKNPGKSGGVAIGITAALIASFFIFRD